MTCAVLCWQAVSDARCCVGKRLVTRALLCWQAVQQMEGRLQQFIDDHDGVGMFELESDGAARYDDDATAPTVRTTWCDAVRRLRSLTSS